MFKRGKNFNYKRSQRDLSRSKRYKRKKRPQRVRFRRKYAKSVAVTVFKPIWSLIKTSIIVFVVAFVAIRCWNFWNNSPLIQINEIQFEGDIPRGLKTSLEIEEGQNIFLIPTRKLQKEALASFTQLDSLSIRRSSNRSVRVFGIYRDPIARLSGGGGRKLIDKAGVIFELRNSSEKLSALPVFPFFKRESDRKEWTEVLWEMKNSFPDFYSRLKQIKTDTIQSRSVIIVDGIKIYWGEFSLSSLEPKMNKIDKVLNRFKPRDRNVSIRFVDGNRLILEGSWKDTQST